ncbi:hypothetical protein [Nocardioides sp. cx-173]|uniref:hypothetical protein n=1 Tax=Nocardioides sp. cx-173 TaxID=2898796 RepID=UPI001E5E4BF2|nr:hypothetical protein [Nocardioides sp. cx-173]MCD4525708.1 hypothetical protein [Nocardioides sp. cx-173]UGB42846.1 hypothetical protein LQ940_04805 [Nocardioides sp. cx-173]
MEYYDASSAEPAEPVDLLLESARAGGAAATLEARLAEVDDLVDRILDEEASRPLEPEIVEALEQLTGADDAPAHFRTVHDRVERRAITWERFWQRPQDEYRGFEIVQAAIVATTREMGATLDRYTSQVRRG